MIKRTLNGLVRWQQHGLSSEAVVTPARPLWPVLGRW